MSNTQEITDQVNQHNQWVAPLQEQIGRVVVGQKYLIDGLLVGLLTNGHILLEGVPGLAKTLAVKTLANCVHTGFQRIQFTPDLLPDDDAPDLLLQRGDPLIVLFDLVGNFLGVGHGAQ